MSLPAFCATVTGRLPSTVIRLEGELDLLTATSAMEVVQAEIDAGALHIVLDLAGLAFIDTSGAGGLQEMRREAERAGVDLVAANPGRAAAFVLQVAGVPSVTSAWAETTSSP